MKKCDKHITPKVFELKKKVRITHPFHPRFSEEFFLIEYRRSGGLRAQVHLQDSKGNTFSVPLSSTDAEEADVFVHISAGRSYFHIKDLIRLVYLFEGMNGKERIGSNSKKG
ncbi:MAG: DUF5372 family protein [Chitinispirillia bacterium]|jgi:hypothetical protein